MKNFFLCCFFFSLNVSFAQPTNKTLKGTWAMTALVQDSSVIMFKQDSVLRSIISKQSPSFVFRQPGTAGSDASFLMYNGMYLGFRKSGVFVNGWVKDSSYSRLDKSFYGMYYLDGTTMNTDFVVLKAGGKYTRFDRNMYSRVTFSGNYLVVAPRGSVYTYYLTRISEDVLFE